MLRTYKPLKHHEIYVYQTHIQQLVCDVWCNAQNGTDCVDLLTAEFEKIYLSRDWVKSDVDEIYQLCKTLTADQRTEIREAFVINNSIEELCEATREPVKLDKLPNVVGERMKTFLTKCYNDLISSKDKLSYYNALIENQKANYKFCPCCGLVPVESSESRFREDNDHYGPKADYPFASVNFLNLVPLCSKCNKKCKSTKDPFENRRKSYYAFKPLPQEFTIKTRIKNTDTTDYGVLTVDEIDFTFNNDPEKVATWNWLFEIRDRYNEEIRQFSKTELRMLANRFKRNEERKQGVPYEQIVNDAIEDYLIDRFDDRKFLKASFLAEMLSKPEWLAVYR